MCEEDGGRACRVAGVGLRMHVGVLEDAGRWIRMAGVVNRAFWRCRACVLRGMHGEWCDLLRRQAPFCVAGAGNRVRQLKPPDFVALCEKTSARVRVDVCGAAKSWQAQRFR